MQHRKELIHEASKSLLRYYPTLGQSEIREIVKQGYRDHLANTGNTEATSAVADRQIDLMTFEEILNILCFGSGDMSCDAVEESQYR